MNFLLKYGKVIRVNLKEIGWGVGSEVDPVGR
jgi:hypothetical protein